MPDPEQSHLRLVLYPSRFQDRDATLKPAVDLYVPQA
jgi:hypothetical protein